MAVFVLCYANTAIFDLSLYRTPYCGAEHLKDKLPEIGEEERLKLLATNGMLMKRPILVGG